MSTEPHELRAALSSTRSPPTVDRTPAAAAPLSCSQPAWTPLHFNAWKNESPSLGPTPAQKAPLRPLQSPEQDQEDSVATLLLESPAAPLPLIHPVQESASLEVEMEWSESMATPPKCKTFSELSQDLVPTLPLPATEFKRRSLPQSPLPIPSLRCHEELSPIPEELHATMPVTGDEENVAVHNGRSHQPLPEASTEWRATLPLEDHSTPQQQQQDEAHVVSPQTPAAREPEQPLSGRMAAALDVEVSQAACSPLLFSQSSLPCSDRRQRPTTPSSPWKPPTVVRAAPSPPATSSPRRTGPSAAELAKVRRKEAQDRLSKLQGSVSQWGQRYQREQSASGSPGKLPAIVSAAAMAAAGPMAVASPAKETRQSAGAGRFTSRMTPVPPPLANNNKAEAAQRRAAAKLANLAQFVERQSASQPCGTVVALPDASGRPDKSAMAVAPGPDPAARLAHFDKMFKTGLLFENVDEDNDTCIEPGQSKHMSPCRPQPPAAPLAAGFKTASNKTILLSEHAKNQAADFQRRMVGSLPAPALPPAPLQTGPMPLPAVSPVACEAAAMGSGNNFGNGFKTASDKPIIAISAAAKSKAFEMQQFLAGHSASFPADLSRHSHSPERQAETETVLPPSAPAFASSGGGFKTASNKPILLSDSARQRAHDLQCEMGITGPMLPAAVPPVTSAAVENTQMDLEGSARHTAGQKALAFERFLTDDQTLVPEMPPVRMPALPATPITSNSCGGFKTASDKKITLSAAAQQKALQFMSTLDAGMVPALEPETVPEVPQGRGLHGFGPDPGARAAGGFRTAGERPIALSAVARQKALAFERLLLEPSASGSADVNGGLQESGSGASSSCKVPSDSYTALSPAAQQRDGKYWRLMQDSDTPAMTSPASTTASASPAMFLAGKAGTPTTTPLHTSRRPLPSATAKVSTTGTRRPQPKFNSPASAIAGKATPPGKHVRRSTPFRPPRVASPSPGTTTNAPPHFKATSVASPLKQSCKSMAPPDGPASPPQLYQQRKSGPRVSLASFAGHDSSAGAGPNSVPTPLMEVSAANAARFRWSASLLLELGAQLACGEAVGHVMAAADGSVGLDEIFRAFTACPAVQLQHASLAWVSNHYRWLVWKLAAMARRFPGQCRTWASPDRLLQELHYRYHREYVDAERSALTRVLQKDEFANRYMILCVSAILGASTIELTDGWYALRTELDPGLADLLASKRIVVGQKLCVQGARLSAEEAVSPLERPESLRLLIHLNGTRRARSLAKLGHQRLREFPLPLRSLKMDGGDVAETEFVILRKYPLQYMETHADKSKTFRNERGERLAEQRWLEHCERETQKRCNLLENLSDQPAQGLASQSPKKQQQPSLEAVAALSSGQAVLEALQTATDPDWVKASLSPAQLALLEQHKQVIVDQRAADAREQLVDMANLTPRVVTPLVKFRVADVSLPLFTMEFAHWRPDATLLAQLKEGCVVRASHLNVSKKPGFQCKELSLNGKRGSKLMPRQEPLTLPEGLFVPRTCHTFSTIATLTGGSEFDTVGLVIEVCAPRNSKAGPVQEMMLANENSQRLCVTFWGGIDQVAISKQALVPGAAVAFLNLRFRLHDAQEEVCRVTFTKETCLLASCRERYLEQPRQHLEKEARRIDLLRLILHPPATQWAKPKPVTPRNKLRRPSAASSRPRPLPLAAVPEQAGQLSPERSRPRMHRGYLCPGQVVLSQPSSGGPVVVHIHAAAWVEQPTKQHHQEQGGRSQHQERKQVEKEQEEVMESSMMVVPCPICLEDLRLGPEAAQIHIDGCLNTRERQQSLRKRKSTSAPIESTSQKGTKARRTRSGGSQRCTPAVGICVRHSAAATAPTSVAQAATVAVTDAATSLHPKASYVLLCDFDDGVEAHPMVLPSGMVGQLTAGWVDNKNADWLETLLTTGAVGDLAHVILAPLRQQWCMAQGIVTASQLLEAIFAAAVVVEDHGAAVMAPAAGGELPMATTLRNLSSCRQCQETVPETGCLVFTLTEWEYLMDKVVQSICFQHTEATFAPGPAVVTPCNVQMSPASAVVPALLNAT